MRPQTVHPEALMVATRLISMGLGVLYLPILIHFLRAEAFASWALLLAFGNLFSMLDLGMPPAVVKFAAFPIQQKDYRRTSRIVTSVIFFLIVIFAISFLFVFALSGWLVAVLKIPATSQVSVKGLILFVFVAAALRSIFQNAGVNLFYAAQQFGSIAWISLVQPVLSNGFATVAAITTQRLDRTVEFFWLGQLAVVGAVFVWGKFIFHWRLQPRLLETGVLRELMGHGMKVQISNFAEFVNFQFNKFIISAFIGLWGVAPYEVANRSVLALKSIPSSGLETFLPSAAIRLAQGEEGWLKYIRMTKIATYGVLFFIVAPLSISSLFLYAWAGEMGYVSRWFFAPLAIGAAGSILALPAATMVQAAARTDIQAKAALLSVVINLPLSFGLMLVWETHGLVLGSAAAMLISSGFLIAEAHRLFAKSARATFREIARLWPLVAICAVWAAASAFCFSAWFAGLPAANRFARENRLIPGLISAGLYFGCVVSMLVVQRLRGDFEFLTTNFFGSFRFWVDEKQRPQRRL